MNAGRTAAIVAGLFAIASAAILALNAPPAAEPMNALVDRWLASMRLPSGDRGWSLLSLETRQAVYGNDPRLYWDDLEAADWTSIEWAPASGDVDDGRFYRGLVSIRSHPSTLPRFLIERRLVAASCVDDQPTAIGIAARTGWFTAPRLDAQMTFLSSTLDCAARFYGSAGVEHEPFDVVGMAWGTWGPNQRVGVLDAANIVESIGGGRAAPPLRGSAVVTEWETKQLAVTWRGSSCDTNTALLIDGTPADLIITIRRGIDVSCEDDDTVYESIIAFSTHVDAADVRLRFASGTRVLP